MKDTNESPEKVPTCVDKGEYCMGKYKEYCKVCLKNKSPEKDVKTKEELIVQYASRCYEHIANEPQFDFAMAEFGMPDLLDMMDEYANQFKLKPANNDYAVKVLKDRIPQLLETKSYSLVDELNYIIKLLQK